MILLLNFSIIWQATVGHTIQNNPSWDFAANPRIAPWQLSRAPPSEKPEKFSEADYESYLPTGEMFQYQFNFVYLQTTENSWADYLDKFDNLMITRHERQRLKRFRIEIEGVSRELKKNYDDNFPFPFDYVLAEKLTTSIYS